MTLNVTFQRQSLKTTTQLMQMGWLVLVAAVASLLLAFRHQNGIMLGVVLALATLVVPAGFVLGRRMVEKVRQRETEAVLASGDAGDDDHAAVNQAHISCLLYLIALAFVVAR